MLFFYINVYTFHLNRQQWTTITTNGSSNSNTLCVYVVPHTLLGFSQDCWSKLLLTHNKVYLYMWRIKPQHIVDKCFCCTLACCCCCLYHRNDNNNNRHLLLLLLPVLCCLRPYCGLFVGSFNYCHFCCYLLTWLTRYVRPSVPQCVCLAFWYTLLAVTYKLALKVLFFML